MTNTTQRSRARRVLIAGTAGAGRRALGSFLARERDFHLLDAGIERDEGRIALRAAIAAERDIVVTWTGCKSGASPEWLRAWEFEFVWLDGDRGANRPGGFRFVDPFDASGAYRPLSELAAELLASVPAPGRALWRGTANCERV